MRNPSQSEAQAAQISWALISVIRKGTATDVAKPSLGRAPSPSEYDEIKRERASNPAKHLRLGDIASDGRVFLRINPTGLDGEQWTNPAGLGAVLASARVYRGQNKAKTAATKKEYYLRNKARLRAYMKRWQKEKKEHLLEYKKAYYAKTRERRSEKYKQGAEYFRQASKRNRRGKSDRQAAYSSAHRARKITSDLGLSRQKVWRKVYRMFFDIAAKFTKESGTLHTVDHIWPIVARRGQPIGLHVPWNLRVAVAQTNMSKHNRPPTQSEIEEGMKQWVEVLGLLATRHPQEFATIKPQICF